MIKGQARPEPFPQEVTCGLRAEDWDEELAKKTPPLKWPLLGTALMTQQILRPFLGQANGQVGEDSKHTPTSSPPTSHQHTGFY